MNKAEKALKNIRDVNNLLNRYVSEIKKQGFRDNDGTYRKVFDDGSVLTYRLNTEDVWELGVKK